MNKVVGGDSPPLRDGRKTMIETKKNFGPWNREPAQGASWYIPKFEISLVSTFSEKVGKSVDPRYGYGIFKYNVGWYRVEQTPLSAAESADRGVFWAGASSLYNPLSIMIGWYRAESAPVPELDPGKGAFSV